MIAFSQRQRSNEQRRAALAWEQQAKRWAAVEAEFGPALDAMTFDEVRQLAGRAGRFTSRALQAGLDVRGALLSRLRTESRTESRTEQ